MYDQFDKQLAERIQHVFDTYEDSSADQGWAELRKSFPEKKSRRPLIYWISSAAAILLLAGAGLWFSQRPVLNEKLAKTKSPVTSTTNQRMQAATQSKARAPQHEPASLNQPGARLTALSHQAPATSRKTESLRSAQQSSLAETGGDNTSVISSPLLAAAVSSADSTSAATALYAAAVSEQRPARIPNEAAPIEEKTIAEKLASIKELTVTKTPARKTGKVSVGVFAGSFINYSEGSKAGMNPGVGLLSELALSKKLKLSTGLTLAQNTLKFDHVPAPQMSAAMMAAPSEAPAASDKNITNSFMARTSSSSFSMDGYNATLLGLDIPVNLKYMLVENKRDLYVLAGLSSNFFIDESYTYKYSDISYTLDGESRDARESTSRNSSFDFARMFNFSVGFGYPVGKQNKLSVEPFVKYPLGGLGSQNIRFGSAGLNLKFNFNTGL